MTPANRQLTTANIPGPRPGKNAYYFGKLSGLEAPTASPLLFSAPSALSVVEGSSQRVSEL